MTDVSLDFTQALLLDMERKGHTERSLGKVLGITQQAIHRWVERGYPPLSRLDALVEALGPDSAVGKLSKDKIYAPQSRTIRSAMLSLDGAPPDYSPYEAVLRQRAAYTVPRKDAPNEGVTYGAQEQLGFGSELTPGMRACVEMRVKLPSGQTFTFDYLSRNLAAELVYVAGSQASANTGNIVLRLVTFAKAVNPDIKLMLIVVSRDHKVNLPPHVLAAANAFGVTIAEARSGVEAARVLALAQEAADAPPALQEPDE
jgi:hypothetical protein